jgi:serine/threonine protein kinase
MEVSREISIMRALRHRNIVELLDCHPVGRATLELVMPFVAGGSVHALVKQVPIFPLEHSFAREP